jgi:predicted enzyme related to lactoylglutathione lyase/ABC-type transporter Mla MlaB component
MRRAEKPGRRGISSRSWRNEPKNPAGEGFRAGRGERGSDVPTIRSGRPSLPGTSGPAWNRPRCDRWLGRLGQPVPHPVVLCLSGALAPDRIHSLCDRVRALLEASEKGVMVCDVAAVRSDAVTVEALARLQLTARRSGCCMRLRHACDELRDLITLFGLEGVLPLVEAVGEGRRGTSDERRKMGAPVVHFEVVTNKDAEGLQKFYADVFGWNVQNPPEMPEGMPPYGLVSAEDAGIGGGIGATGNTDTPGHVTFYIGVPDPEATMQQIESLGGTRVMGPAEIVPGTVIGLFKDPDGNMVGLSKVE